MSTGDTFARPLPKAKGGVPRQCSTTLPLLSESAAPFLLAPQPTPESPIWAHPETSLRNFSGGDVTVRFLSIRNRGPRFEYLMLLLT